MNVLVLSGPNHRFNESADVIYDFLKDADDLSVTLEDDKAILHSDKMDGFDVLVFGTGFRRSEKQADGSSKRVGWKRLGGHSRYGMVDWWAGC